MNTIIAQASLQGDVSTCGIEALTVPHDRTLFTINETTTQVNQCTNEVTTFQNWSFSNAGIVGFIFIAILVFCVVMQMVEKLAENNDL